MMMNLLTNPFHKVSSNDDDNDINHVFPRAPQPQDFMNSQDDNDQRISPSSPSHTQRLNQFSFLMPMREKVGAFVNHDYVEGIILSMIMINAAMIGISTFNVVSENPDVNSAFELTDLIFLIVFTFESSLRLIHLGFGFWKDSWSVFDAVLIIFSWAFSSGSIKAIRALRILRILPRVKVLKEVINSIIVVMPKMGAVAALLSLIMFIFSILVTQLFGDMYENNQTGDTDYFSRLDLSLFTLFQLMTLDGWNDVVREIMDTYTWAWIPLLIYILLTGIVVTNIVIAVVCDSILSMNEDEEEERAKSVDEQLKLCIKEMIAFKEDLNKKVCLNNHVQFSLKQSNEGLQMMQSISYHDTDADVISSIRERNQNKVKKYQAGLPGFRQRCGDFVNSKHVQIFIMVLIIINAIMMAIGTFSFVENNSSAQNIFDLTDRVFLTIYSVESALQIIYHGVYIYKDGWAMFDLILVILSWTLMATPIPTQAARSLRIIRVLRLVPKLKALKLIVSAVIRVLPKLGGIGGILALVYYIFAIIFTVLFQDIELEEGDENVFASLDATLFTLFQIMTMSDWASLSRDLVPHNRWAPILIIIFLVVSGFIFLNLIIALICEAMGLVEEVNNELNHEVIKCVPVSTTESLRAESLTTLDRLRYLENTQKEIRLFLSHCTIIADREDFQSVASSKSSSGFQNDSSANLEVYLDASED